MINIYDTANQLASDFQETDQFKKLAEAINQVKANETSLKLYQEMESFQKTIMAKTQAGQDLDENEKAKYQELNKKIGEDKNVQAVIKAEQGLYVLLDDVQKTIAKPITDLYKEISIG